MLLKISIDTFKFITCQNLILDNILNKLENTAFTIIFMTRKMILYYWWILKTSERRTALSFFKKWSIYLYACVFCLSVFMCTMCLQRPEEHVGSPGTGCTGSCKLLCRYWKLNPALFKSHVFTCCTWVKMFILKSLPLAKLVLKLSLEIQFHMKLNRWIKRLN